MAALRLCQRWMRRKVFPAHLGMSTGLFAANDASICLRSAMTVGTFMINQSNLRGRIGALFGPLREANEDLNPAWGKDVNSFGCKPQPYRRLGSLIWSLE